MLRPLSRETAVLESLVKLVHLCPSLSSNIRYLIRKLANEPRSAEGWRRGRDGWGGPEQNAKEALGTDVT